jgi:hypothetical protein
MVGVPCTGGRSRVRSGQVGSEEKADAEGHGVVRVAIESPYTFIIGNS